MKWTLERDAICMEDGLVYWGGIGSSKERFLRVSSPKGCYTFPAVREHEYYVREGTASTDTEKMNIGYPMIQSSTATSI